jgi:hypothetical protein
MGRVFSCREKVFALGWLTATTLIWGLVRSNVLEAGVDGKGLNALPVEVSLLFMGLFGLPVLIAWRSPARLWWLLGTSVTIGLLPAIPLMPYLRDASHLIFLVIAARGLFDGALVSGSISLSLPMRIYVGFVGVCAFSICLAQAWGTAGTWELKVGVAELVVLLSITFGVCYTLANDSERERLLDQLLDGFAWATLAQVAIILLAVYLAFTRPLLPGNDTLAGLGYWDRVKSTFSNPDQAGVFFATAIPLLVLWAHRRGDHASWRWVSAYLQLAPWMIMASGSRTGKIAMVIALLASILPGDCRHRVQRAVPSFVLAGFVGFMYQSFPFAVDALVCQAADLGDRLFTLLSAHGLPLADLVDQIADHLHAIAVVDANQIAGMSFRGRFFQDSRWDMMARMWDYFIAEPTLQQVFGNGAGIGGYRLSGYPSAHNLLDLLIEVGLFGTAVLVGFFSVLIARLTSLARQAGADRAAATAALLLFGALLAAAAGGATYRADRWGFVMVVFAMAILFTPDVGRRPAIASEGSAPPGAQSAMP